jgi:multidrug efflux pump subunit AcrB
MQTPQEFRDIILRTNANGSNVRLSDVARVSLGGENFNFRPFYNNHPATGFAIKLAPGANALDTVAAVKRRLPRFRPSSPPTSRSSIRSTIRNS